MWTCPLVPSTTADASHHQCSREWPCNHCQARKVPHLCQFAPKKVATPEDDSFAPPATYGTIPLEHLLISIMKRWSFSNLI